MIKNYIIAFIFLIIMDSIWLSEGPISDMISKIQLQKLPQKSVILYLPTEINHPVV